MRFNLTIVGELIINGRLGGTSPSFNIAQAPVAADTDDIIANGGVSGVG